MVMHQNDRLQSVPLCNFLMNKLPSFSPAWIRFVPESEQIVFTRTIFNMARIGLIGSIGLAD